MRGLGVVAIVVASIAVPVHARADVEVHDDGFVSGDLAVFEDGFNADEIAASRLIAPEAGRKVLKVRFLFGGGTTAFRAITVKVWDDSAGTDIPGAELTALTFTIESSDTTFQDLDIAAAQVVVPQQFRIGILFKDPGAPSIAHDTDGIHVGENLIMDFDGTWHQAQTEGIQGDWILRAVISGDATSAVDTNGADAGTGGCNANPDCPFGQFCDLDHHTCTFDCRSDDDCGSGHCNSLGLCVNAETGGGGGGCCQTNGDASTPIVASAIWLWLMARRHGRRSQP